MSKTSLIIILLGISACLQVQAKSFISLESRNLFNNSKFFINLENNRSQRFGFNTNSIPCSQAVVLVKDNIGFHDTDLDKQDKFLKNILPFINEKIGLHNADTDSQFNLIKTIISFSPGKFALINTGAKEPLKRKSFDRIAEMNHIMSYREGGKSHRGFQIKIFSSNF